MKKRFLGILLVVLMVATVFALTSCDLLDIIFGGEEEHQHEWGEWETNIEPTCVTPGDRTRYCLSCDESEKESIPATGIHKSGDWIVDSKATCIEEGSQHKECKICSKVLETQSIPVTDIHKSETWIIDSEATCEAAGSRHKECDLCGATFDAEEILPSHKFENDICVLCNCSNTSFFIFRYLEETNSYSISVNKEATLPELIALPDLYNGLPVTHIDVDAFKECMSLIGIVIPGSITAIDDDAFYNCTNLKDVYISDIVAWLNIEYGNYYSHPNIYGTLHILDPNGDEVTKVVVPDGVTTIPDYAFGNANKVTIITFPDSITNIGKDVFQGCTNLKDIYINNLDSWLNSGNSNSFGSTHIIDKYGKEVTTIVIPDGITSIPDYAFCNAKNITSVVIPDSVTYIGVKAFYIAENSLALL